MVNAAKRVSPQYLRHRSNLLHEQIFLPNVQLARKEQNGMQRDKMSLAGSSTRIRNPLVTLSRRSLGGNGSILVLRPLTADRTQALGRITPNNGQSHSITPNDTNRRGGAISRPSTFDPRLT